MHGTFPSQIILDAYREGIFPMAESGDEENFAFYKPYQRGLLSITDLHIPAKLLKKIRKGGYSVSVNKAFRDIIDGCAAQTERRAKTWINRPIRNMFVQLHREGHAHSVEVWSAQGALMGGLYGVAIGAVFCGESMVSFEEDGSKIALVFLCALLHHGGYTVLDTQFLNPHLLQFGAYEIPQAAYEALIRVQMNQSARPITQIVPDNALMAAYLANRSQGDSVL